MGDGSSFKRMNLDDYMEKDCLVFSYDEVHMALTPQVFNLNWFLHSHPLGLPLCYRFFHVDFEYVLVCLSYGCNSENRIT